MTADVSVVIPYFNAASTIRRALASIRAQTQSVKEVLIVNDGSDFSALNALVEEFRADLNLRLIDLKVNCGAACARNTGVANASCAFIAFLDADDVWHPEKIAVQYEFMRTSGAYLTCHGYVFDINHCDMNARQSTRARKLHVFDFTYKTYVFTPTVMVLKERFVEFDIRLSRSEDIKCWISNFENGDFIFLSANLGGGYKHPVGQSGLSGSYALMHKEHLHAWKLLYRERKVNFIHFGCAVVAEFIKYPIRRLRQNGPVSS